MISYYSTDTAANKEKPQDTTVGLNKPDFPDIQNIITNSNIDNPGTKNALIAKLSTGQAQVIMGLRPNALNALSNQLDALDGKHGLDRAKSIPSKRLS